MRCACRVIQADARGSNMPGSSALLQDIRRVTASALQSGALCPIGTESVVLEEQRTSFLVRVLSGLQHKVSVDREQRARREAGENVNPFLPYEQALLVRELSASHVCLLNKYSVVDDHVLVITRDFEPQGSVLTPADFQAVWGCLSEVDSLCFFNSHREAGASQPHKHLQLVPRHAVSPAGMLPFSSQIIEGLEQGSGRIALPFRHGIIDLRPLAGLGADQAVARLNGEYRALMTELSLWEDASRQLTRPHNLLMTRDWLFIVPRRQALYGGFAVNALGYAGTMLVRSVEQVETLRDLGVHHLLSEVALPW